MPSSHDHPLSAELRVAVQRLSRRLRQEKADDELSDSQSSVLAYLLRSGARTPAELSAFEHVTPPSMNRTLNALQTAGYVVRTPDEADGRKVIVTLTGAGRDFVVETRRRRDEWLEQGLATLSPAELALLAQAAPIIRKLTE
ncbi:MarR family transcriptional regulator [Herbiconiux sp.]|uniref:MarR family winged helix-turn-helix transcriptional regulator n=1 Tax=Herbiconiux sp. TaxID=1871186 RepID=UPI0025B9367A|nr:MarR family transcriptional regulator [Herbiconiux sp.]